MCDVAEEPFSLCLSLSPYFPFSFLEYLPALWWVYLQYVEPKYLKRGYWVAQD